MNRKTKVLGVMAVCVALAVAGGPALAKLVAANLGLTEGPAMCDGNGTYTYPAVWKAKAGAVFAVQTGNACTLSSIPCGINNKSCLVTCAAGGTCTAPVSHCQIGRGAAWVRVVAMDGTVMQQIKAPAPSRCINGKP
ncbi:hypothetical protein BH11PSE2_BH11PSE2_12250 [soil metagenome]